jgi:hypothetical protein
MSVGVMKDSKSFFWDPSWGGEDGTKLLDVKEGVKRTLP